MAAAIPAAIGLGSSVIGGIKGKGAAKKQQQLQAQQYAMLKPLIEQQTANGQYATNTSKPLIAGASQGLNDLSSFWKPLMSGDRSAIDQFLSPERRAINQGYQSMSNNLATFAPRGGGRNSALANADMQRQGKLSDLVFGARREAAGQNFNIANALGSLGTNLFGAGNQATGNASNQLSGLYNSQANRTMQANQQAGANLGDLGGALGGFLGSLNFGKKSGGSSGWSPVGPGE